MPTDNVVPFQPAGKVATILVVDDEEGVRRLLTHWIQSLGYAVLSASDSESALSMLRATHVDVAVCDIRMPGQDGVWLIDQLRRDYPTTAVVIATGLPDMSATVTLQAGVAGYLIKPFERQDLATVLNHALMPDSPWTRDHGQPLDLDELPEI